ncbi:hypothetical protein ACNKHS_21765 [Shigella flexneri]
MSIHGVWLGPGLSGHEPAGAKYNIFSFFVVKNLLTWQGFYFSLCLAMAYYQVVRWDALFHAVDATRYLLTL